MAADGTNPTNLSRNPARTIALRLVPRRCHDSFETNRDNNSEIYLVETDGANPFNLSRNPEGDFGVTYSPDGYKLAFTSTRDGT